MRTITHDTGSATTHPPWPEPPPIFDDSAGGSTVRRRWGPGSASYLRRRSRW